MGVGTPATVALTATGIRFPAHSHRHDPSNRHFGWDGMRR